MSIGPTLRTFRRKPWHPSGEGHIAYIKQIRSEDVPNLFPEAPHIAPGLKLFTLHSADGISIMLTDSREAALANRPGATSWEALERPLSD